MKKFIAGILLTFVVCASSVLHPLTKEGATTSYPAARLVALEATPKDDGESNADDLPAAIDELPQQSIVGCMASTCHGSAQADALPWQTSGTVWFNKDPHAKAYVRLLSDESLAIVNRFTGATIQSVSDPEYAEALKLNCNSCHTNSKSNPAEHVLGADCQVCHGPASAWNANHYSAEWKAKGNARFLSSAMTNTESLATVVATCASCHIGDMESEFGERQVNHNLMASGHPPMHFDYQTYLSRYPKHWDEKNESDLESTSGEFDRWRIGRLATAATRLKLTIARATQVKKDDVLDRRLSTTVWPELTEFSCYKCHHSLDNSRWQKNTSGKGVAGWDSWTTSQLELAISASHRTQFISSMNAFVSSIETPVAERTTVMKNAEVVLQQIQDELKTLNAIRESNSNIALEAMRILLESCPNDFAWETSVPWYVTLRSASLQLKLNVPAEMALRTENALGYRSKGINIQTPAKWDEVIESIMEEYRAYLANVMRSSQL